ncbi:hypothetical protein L914_15033 [Phytophthora nicotianae]|uniref:Uncharacterized protein n=1 Tax=Phytophthora nicotianae TaxID=4792 RepID=W2MQW0_PHYNI|nr:hypothetical protein L914_15033 [Phytophthora nicotianae]
MGMKAPSRRHLTNIRPHQQPRINTNNPAAGKDSASSPPSATSHANAELF